MIFAHTIEQLRNAVQSHRKQNRSIGFVPTMGYLHEGHLQLAKRAKQENDIVVMSIFVNPTQFGPNEDFDRYPRDLERDQQLAESVGVDIIFAPSVEEMYPHDAGIRIHAGSQANVLCGASREGHFDGVLRVVSILFNLVTPDRVYFGQKDAQQVAIIQSYIRDYHVPVKLAIVPTVRESDGLAKSSRNVFLSDKEREEAVYLFKALNNGVEVYTKTKDVNLALSQIKEMITSNTSGEIDYVEAWSYPDLLPVEGKESTILFAVAVKFQHARLIDNQLVQLKENE